ncbi:Transcriptional regulator, MarR family, partial [uncultured Microcoleus sp.]
GAVLLVARRRFADFQHWRQTATGKRDAGRRDRSHGRKRPSPPGERHPRSPHLAHLADRLRQGTARGIAPAGSCHPRSSCRGLL